MSFSIISSASGHLGEIRGKFINHKAHKEWSDESDDKVRGCKISLFRRKCGPIGIVAFHWTLNFEWEGGYQATYEAIDENGTLTANWCPAVLEDKGDDGEVYEWKFWDTYEANDCSPREVNLFAKDLHIGDMEYNLMSTNCHEWAKALASKFGVTLPPGAASVVLDCESRVVETVHQAASEIGTLVHGTKPSTKSSKCCTCL